MKIDIPKAIIALLLLASCSAKNEKSRYEILTEYEGKFEYMNATSLAFTASNYDTTLYAVLDDARYPLTYVGIDTFENRQKTPVIFHRNEKGEVVSYATENKTFKRISNEIEKQEWFPRKELYNDPDAFVYSAPREMSDGLQTGDLKDAFTQPDLIVEMVKRTIKGEYPDVHSILIMKDDKLVLEEYFYGYSEDKPHQLRSASKSFIGTLMGIAIDQGKIKGENEKLLPFFKKEYSSIENPHPLKDRLTIKDFLTYRHGMDCENDNPESAGNEHAMMKADDWVKFILDLPMTGEPGVKSSYCTGCSTTIGRLIELATQTSLVEYAEKNLFSPMGITNYHWRFKPDTSSATTFNQMYLRPRDVMKLAKLYQDGGKWQSKQIVSGDWIKKTFAKEDPEFGYLWRHKYFDVNGKRYNSYLATGNGGQKINIWPELNMITVFTGGNYNSFIYGRQTPPNEMIPEYILKAL